jgi:hypothetical protein
MKHSDTNLFKRAYYEYFIEKIFLYEIIFIIYYTELFIFKLKFNINDLSYDYVFSEFLQTILQFLIFENYPGIFKSLNGLFTFNLLPLEKSFRSNKSKSKTKSKRQKLIH